MKRRLATIGMLVVTRCVSSEPPVVQELPASVAARDVALVRRASVRTGPRIVGSLEARNRAIIRSEIGGAIVMLGVEVGDVVKKGRLLARLEDRVLRNASHSADVQVVAAQADLLAHEKQSERTERLVEGGALALKDLETAGAQRAASQARLDAARAVAAQARERLGWANVVSPIDGVIAARDVAQGDVVQVGATMFTVIEPTSMRLKASVASAQLGNVSVGARVTFSVKGYPTQVFTGRVERIAPMADDLTRQIPLWVSIPNADGRLVAGLFAEGRVDSQSRDALVLPADSIAATTSPLAKRVLAGRVQDISVHLGMHDDIAQTIEILDGLTEGDVILRGAALSLAAGTMVRIERTTPDAIDTHRPDTSSGANAE